MRTFCLLLASCAALFAAPASAATWTNADSAAVMTSEKGVRIYRGAAPASTLEGVASEVAAPPIAQKVSLSVKCERRIGYPARRLTTHGFLGIKRYYTALGQRSFN